MVATQRKERPLHSYIISGLCCILTPIHCEAMGKVSSMKRVTQIHTYGDNEGPFDMISLYAQHSKYTMLLCWGLWHAVYAMFWMFWKRVSFPAVEVSSLGAPKLACWWHSPGTLVPAYHVVSFSDSEFNWKTGRIGLFRYTVEPQYNEVVGTSW